MENRNLFLMFVFILGVFVACSKEDAATGSSEGNDQKATMSLLKSGQITPPANQKDFTILNAGISGKYLFLSLEYAGGEKRNEFAVVWNGQQTKDGDKNVIELVVSRQTTDDNGTQIRKDSLASDLSKLLITEKDLADPNLWFKVVNSSKISNTFTFHALKSATINGSNPVPVTKEKFTTDVKVIEAECSNVGVWGNLWLKSVQGEQYFVVTAIDQSINYKSAKNDQLKISYEYGFVADSAKACPSYSTLHAIPVKLLTVEKK